MISLVNIYRSTLKSLFYNGNKRTIISTKYGHELIKNAFTQTELLEMEILGIFLFGDNGVFINSDINVHEFVFFVEGECDINNIYNTLPLCKTTVCIHFYTPINADLANRIKIFDVNEIVNEITASSISIISVSDHVAVSDKTSILAVIKSRPKKIVTPSGQASDPIITKITNKINECVSACNIYEKQDPSIMVVGLERSYDKITPLIIPWRYESMLHFHKIKLQDYFGHCTDDFFSANAYELYENVIHNIEIEKAKVEKKNFQANLQSKSAIATLEIEKLNKMVNKHVDALNKLSSLIKKEDMFTKSEQEQSAIIRALSNKQKTDFLESRPVIAQIIYSAKPGPTQKGSVYYQHVPKIRTLIEKYTNENPTVAHIYFYVSDYICYEEVAEIEIFNRKSKKQQVFLLSDSILDQWNYLATTYKNITSDRIFRINKLVKCNEEQLKIKSKNTSKSRIDVIQEKVILLEKYPPVILDDKQEAEFNSLIKQVTKMLTTEYERLKTIITSNKIEENTKNMEIIKLNKLATRFKKLEMARDNRNNIKGLPNYFEKSDKYNAEIHKNQELIHMAAAEEYDDDMTEKLIEQRGKAINNIVEGIFDINKLSLELLLLVQEQSLQLDKIEVQLLTSEELVKKGTVYIQEADKTDQSTVGWQQKITLGLGVIATALMIGAGFKVAKH